MWAAAACVAVGEEITKARLEVRNVETTVTIVMCEIF